jgi:hypothetical protein
VLPDDDPYARQRWLMGRRHPLRALNAMMVRVLGTCPVTVRIDLDSPGQGSTTTSTSKALGVLDVQLGVTHAARVSGTRGPTAEGENDCCSPCRTRTPSLSDVREPPTAAQATLLGRGAGSNERPPADVFYESANCGVNSSRMP